MNKEIQPRPVLAEELAAWRACVGREKTRLAMADVETLRRFALAAGLDPEVEKQVPQLGHWALFPDAVADDRIGPDGHPKRGDFLPDIHLPRRMFAAAELVFKRPLAPGRPVQCVSRISSVEHKIGASGELVFVRVSRELSQEAQLCTREEQTLVYRAAGAPLALPVQTLPDTSAGERWTPGTVALFRFSAVTYNSHRIHYDLPYAQVQEGYPALVVHGPFTAAKLLDFASRTVLHGPARRFAFRGIAPLFVSQPVLLAAGPGSGAFSATRCDGLDAMTAQVE